MITKGDDICVIGFGNIGSMTALALAEDGYNVKVYDSAPYQEVFDRLDPEIASKLEDITEAKYGGSSPFEPLTRLEPADTYIICVQTPVHLNNTPALCFLQGAIDDIAAAIKNSDKDQVRVIIKSTVPIGTCHKIQKSLIYSCQGKAMRVIYAPERSTPGDWDGFKSVDRVVGISRGCERVDGEYMRDLYYFSEGHIIYTDIKTAEASKVIENTYRAVNIGFANEMYDMCVNEDIDFYAMRDIVNTNSKVDLHNSGLGVGGHGVPVDPFFLDYASSDMRGTLGLVKNIPFRPISKATKIANFLIDKGYENPKVAIFGATYKENLRGFVNSPALDLKYYLNKLEIQVEIIDPYYGDGMEDIPDRVRDCDLLIYAVNHDEFKMLNIPVIAEMMRHENLLDYTGQLVGMEKVNVITI